MMECQKLPTMAPATLLRPHVGVQTQFPAIFSCRNQSQSNGSPSGGSDIGAASISIIIHNRFFIQGRETQYIYKLHIVV
jgi:hypothetical protein